jgi:hypothetical protein
MLSDTDWPVVKRHVIPPVSTIDTRLSAGAAAAGVPGD